MAVEMSKIQNKKHKHTTDDVGSPDEAGSSNLQTPRSALVEKLSAAQTALSQTQSEPDSYSTHHRTPSDSTSDSGTAQENGEINEEDAMDEENDGGENEDEAHSAHEGESEGEGEDEEDEEDEFREFKEVLANIRLDNFPELAPNLRLDQQLQDSEDNSSESSPPVLPTFSGSLSLPMKSNG